MATAVILLMLLLASVWWLRDAVSRPLALPQSGAVVAVQPGESLGQFLSGLVAQGYLESSRPLTIWARWRGLDRRVKAGEYRIPKGTSGAALLELLAEGTVVSYQITLPEGITLGEALGRLHNDNRLARVLEGPADPAVLEIVAPYSSPEGLFLPETYQFVRGDSDLDILVRAHRLLQDALRQAWASRAKDLPLTTPYEALILASIVERETAVPSEREAIAGVFVRRLQRGMRLQTDPTVIYGLGEAFDGNLTRKHLADRQNPWNTYIFKGLPPTPIALPGRAALDAALHPLEGKALYFVARGDGYHAFSENLDEHNARVREFQLTRRRDYRSTPGDKD